MIESSYSTKTEHTEKCNRSIKKIVLSVSKTNLDEGHVCCEMSHLEMILKIALDQNITLHVIKDKCLAGVIIYNHQPQHIFIFPTETIIFGTYGHGTSRHPLNRIIFWSISLRNRPMFLSIFNEYHQVQLIHDLVENSFIDSNKNTVKLKIFTVPEDLNTVEKLINKFNTSNCVACGISCQERIYFKSRGCSDHILTFDHDCIYDYHLIILSVLKNGWNGSLQDGHSKLQYRDTNMLIKYRYGLLSLRKESENIDHAMSDFRLFLKFVLTYICMFFYIII